MAQTQQEQLTAISDNFKKIGDPRILNDIYGHIDTFKETFDSSAAIKPGDTLPEFAMTDATGKQVTSSELLAEHSRGLLVTFYRGSWCPYCNIAVQFLQRSQADFASRGVGLVAVTPELPDFSLSMTEKNELKFPVLTDLHNAYAKKLGILYDQSRARELHARLGLDLNVRNAEDTWEVPIPVTLLVDGAGLVRNVYIEVDFRKRLDPKEALEWIDQMEK
ncbi:thioredoxin-like protein [Xylariales sp. PMI_506]|nr:thioredoxin-like protein [Xylariales sp. PMI_506]